MANKVNFKKISVYEGPESSPGFLLWHVSTAWRSSIERMLKEYGLTHPQFVILAAIGWLTKDGDRATQISIGKLAGLDPNTSSQIIKGLEKKELIKREASKDQRAKNPVLTKEGRHLLAQALPAVEVADTKFFNCLNKKEMSLLVKIFQKLKCDH